MGLAVIDEVAHVDEELGILIILPSCLRQGGPAAVVAGLGIGEDEGLETAALSCMERRPGAALITVADAVFIGCTRRKVGDRCRVDICRHAVIAEGVAGSGKGHNRIVIAGLAEFHDGIVFGVVRLPHKGPRRRAVSRNDLADVRGVYRFGRQIVGRGGFRSSNALFGDGLRSRQPEVGCCGCNGQDGDDGDDYFFMVPFHRIPPIPICCN